MSNNVNVPIGKQTDRVLITKTKKSFAFSKGFLLNVMHEFSGKIQTVKKISYHRFHRQLCNQSQN